MHRWHLWSNIRLRRWEDLTVKCTKQHPEVQWSHWTGCHMYLYPELQAESLYIWKLSPVISRYISGRHPMDTDPIHHLGWNPLSVLHELGITTTLRVDLKYRGSTYGSFATTWQEKGQDSHGSTATTWLSYFPSILKLPANPTSGSDPGE